MRLTKLTQSRSAVFGQLGLSFLVTLTWALIIWRALFTPNPPPTHPSLVPSSHLLHPAQTLIWPLSSNLTETYHTFVKWNQSTLTPCSLLRRSASGGRAARPRGGAEGQVREVLGRRQISIRELFPSRMQAVQQLRGGEEGRVREFPIRIPEPLQGRQIFSNRTVCQSET